MPVHGDWISFNIVWTNAYVVYGLQPCSEYEFKVQVRIQGSQPGPYSDVVKNKTADARKYS